MSKAFTRESDDAPEIPIRPLRTSALPPGAKNYLTAAGARQLRDELNDLLNTERPTLAAISNDEAAKSRLAIIDDRADQIQETLRSATVVEVPAAPHDEARFGAIVTVRNRQGEETHYRIVGVDETDIDRDWISWLSPIAKALLNARIGQKVRIKLPAGDDELVILAIRYE